MLFINQLQSNTLNLFKTVSLKLINFINLKSHQSHQSDSDYQNNSNMLVLFIYTNMIEDIS